MENQEMEPNLEDCVDDLSRKRIISSANPVGNIAPKLDFPTNPNILLEKNLLGGYDISETLMEIKASHNSMEDHEEDDDNKHIGVADENNQMSKNIQSEVTDFILPPQKLWDGILYLNTSVIVSVIAFFKSGQRMPDMEWPKYAKVKGKVVLQEFERYVKDLSYSSNRRLMVISLCWKEGSSQSGLRGMQKIANGYREGKRVGLVDIASGVALYVCPSSDTIISTLVELGYLKDRTLDSKEIFIGCVIWRDNVAPPTNHSLPEKPSLNHSSCVPGRKLPPSLDYNDRDDDLPEYDYETGMPKSKSFVVPTMAAAVTEGLQDKHRDMQCTGNVPNPNLTSHQGYNPSFRARAPALAAHRPPMTYNTYQGMRPPPPPPNQSQGNFPVYPLPPPGPPPGFEGWRMP